MTGRRLPWWLDWKPVVGIALGIGLLIYALRDVDAGMVMREMSAADPLLFLAAVTATTLTFAVRAARWRALLDPVRAGTRFRFRFAATTIGFMGNNLLPARLGEFARAYACSRLERIPITASLGSLVVERLFDFFALIAFLVIAILLPGFPPVTELGGQAIGRVLLLVIGLCLGLAVLIMTLVLWPAAAVRFLERTVLRLLPGSFRRPVVDALEAFLSGMASLRQPRLVVETTLWSAAVWLLSALAFWLGFLAFDIHLPFTAAMFLQSVVALAVSLPSAPGFFGLFQAGARIGLVDVWGVEVNKAMGFAIGFHIGGFIPVTVIGLYYVWRLGITWREVTHSEEIVEEAVERGPAGGGAGSATSRPPDA